MIYHMDHLTRLIDHLEWADKRCLLSLKACRVQLPAAVGLYAHILGAEHNWLVRIAGKEPTTAIWPELSLDECEELSADNAAGFREVIAQLTPETINRTVTYKNSRGFEFTTGVEDIIMHVAMHGSYHRGQVAALLRSAGDQPVPTDYIQWVRGSAAATRG